MKSSYDGESSFCARPSIFGPVTVEWALMRKEPRVTRVFLSNPDAGTRRFSGNSLPGPGKKASCKEIEGLLDQIEGFLNGEEVIFSLDLLRLDRCSEFQQKVLLADYSIPRGKVSSYGLLSRHLKIPGGTRAVGTALAANPFPLIIPCHRCIRSDGSLGGYQGGLEMKRALLEKEGFLFNGANRVLNPDFYLFA